MINLGLGRITGLLKELSKPTWSAIHIAGTNGKGSVASYLSSLFLRTAKAKATREGEEELRIGKFTSPHLIDRWDCITINDTPVSESLFLTVENRVKQAAARLESSHSLSTSSSFPQRAADSSSDGTVSTDEDTGSDRQVENEGESRVTPFELLTATAFEIFTQQKCQLAVVECGLGGRLDATNAMDSKNVALSVITKIGLDHQSFLGTTTAAIAREKAGIVRRGIPVVVDGSNDTDTKAVISEIANGLQANVLMTPGTDGDYNYFRFQTEDDIEFPRHQRQNLELALLAFREASSRIPSLEVTALAATAITSNESVIRQAISDVRITNPGRLQQVSITPVVAHYQDLILLDGAHNPQSATVLRQYVDQQLQLQQQKQQQQQQQQQQQMSLSPSSKAETETKSRLEPGLVTKLGTESKSGSEIPSQRTIWIVGMSQGKDAHTILQILLRPHDRFIACGFGSVAGMPWVRCMEPAELAALAKEFVGQQQQQQLQQQFPMTTECENVVDALRHAVACSDSDSDSDRRDHHNQMQIQKQNSSRGRIVVAGSLYLVSDLLRALKTRRAATTMTTT